MPPSRRRRDPSMEIEEEVIPPEDATVQLQRIEDKVVAAETIFHRLPKSGTVWNPPGVMIIVIIVVILLVLLAFLYTESVSR